MFPLINMFDHDRSAARGEMSARKLIVFKHDSILGNAPAGKLFELVEVTRKDKSAPPRSFTDYDVNLCKDKVPQSVSMLELL
jgi:CRISPR-associated protein Csd2